MKQFAPPKNKYALYSKEQLKYERSKGLELTDEENENWYRPDTKDSDPSPSIPVKQLIRQYNEETHLGLEGEDLYTLDESEIEQFEKWKGQLASIPVKEGQEVLEVTPGIWDISPDTTNKGRERIKADGIYTIAIVTRAGAVKCIGPLLNCIGLWRSVCPSNGCCESLLGKIIYPR